MARAETIESVGETGAGGNNSLPHHNICRMELPRALHTWPGLLTTSTITTGSGTGAILIHHHHLHPLQPLHLPYPVPDQHQMHQQLPASSPSSAPPPLQLCSRREERDGGAGKPWALSGEESDADIVEQREASSQQGPLPDLLPRNELPSWSASYHRDPRREAEPELEVRRVANQLRATGDQYNATVLRRAHAAPHWQDWRDACRGLFNFITQSLSALYRLT
ncbi:uncharacterized protein LOC133003309 [Limanda limanda]|uniref:uncharacterized protein LOC133003309 n=1 Tax=Limanda limanda TaxID=27771 RepID=UPI0029C62194|nr:uncharacterized protein LOC133003309 [Limanda limanda]